MSTAKEVSGYTFVPSDEVQRIRRHLDHPILDADGHQVEYLPRVYEILRDLAGADVLDRYKNFRRIRFEQPDNGTFPVVVHWGHPGKNTLDRVTATLPKLLYNRLDEIGLDYCLLYPSGPGLSVSSIPDAEIRQALTRALNTYYVEVFDGYRDRLEPTAVIPMTTPEEAVTELRYAVGELGLKAVVMSGSVPRTERPNGRKVGWIDTLGHDSLFDYDPVWATCVELGIAPAFHGHGLGWGSRISDKNFVYNHIGHFAAAQEAVCRSLIMGGVTQRFPALRCSFLEGGVTWAAQLLGDLLGHYAKRNKDVVTQYDPSEQDPIVREALYRAFAEGRLAEQVDRIEEGFGPAEVVTFERRSMDDFAESLIDGPEDIIDTFRNQLFFGCEADDPLNSLAFNRRLLPRKAQVNAMFASDIGHFDVPDMRGVLPEAWEVVEEGLMSEADFREFTFTNFARMLTGANPDFFKGTVVADYVASQTSLS